MSHAKSLSSGSLYVKLETYVNELRGRGRNPWWVTTRLRRPLWEGSGRRLCRAICSAAQLEQRAYLTSRLGEMAFSRDDNARLTMRPLKQSSRFFSCLKIAVLITAR